MKCYVEAIKNYAVFKGRTTSKEFWMFMLFNILIALAIGFIVAFVLIMAGANDAQLDTICDIVSNVYALFILLPTISITVRRLHDTGMSGWWCLIVIIPILGWIIILIMCMLISEPFPNEYGPTTKRDYGSIMCPSCHIYQDDSLSKCPNCGYNLKAYHLSRVISLRRFT